MLYSKQDNAKSTSLQTQCMKADSQRQCHRGKSTSDQRRRLAPFQLCNRTRGVEDLQTQSCELLQLGINSAVTHTAPVSAELMHKHSTRYTGCCAQEETPATTKGKKKKQVMKVERLKDLHPYLCRLVLLQPLQEWWYM